MSTDNLWFHNTIFALGMPVYLACSLVKQAGVYHSAQSPSTTHGTPCLHGNLTIQGHFKIVHYVARVSVGKRAAGIRLKCLLVVRV